MLAPLSADRIDRLVAAGDVTPGKPLDRALHCYPVTGDLSGSQVIEDGRAER